MKVLGEEYQKMAEDKRRLYVGSLPFKADMESVRDLCEKYGTIEDGEIPVLKVLNVERFLCRA